MDTPMQVSPTLFTAPTPRAHPTPLLVREYTSVRAFHQDAQGGNGGRADGGGTGGDGASGTSIFNQSAASDVQISVGSTGGKGGNADIGSGGNGGSATSATTLTASGSITSFQSSDLPTLGGIGGDSTSGATAGRGGDASDTQVLTSNGSGVFGGSSAVGGDGGNNLGTGIAGAGGNAVSSITGNAPGVVLVTADAEGGFGGCAGGGCTSGQPAGTAGQGGNATAAATATSMFSSATAAATAISGAGGPNDDQGNFALDGNASAVATAVAGGGGGAAAFATSFSGTGTSSVIASATTGTGPGGVLAAGTTVASGITATQSSGGAFATFGTAAPSISTVITTAQGSNEQSPEVFGHAVAMPTGISQLLPGANVSAVLGHPWDQVLGAGVLGASYQGGGETDTYSGTGHFVYDVGSFTSGELQFGLVGVLDELMSDPGNTSPNFGFISGNFWLSVSDGGLSYSGSWTFDSLLAMDTFFTDHVLDIGYATDPMMTIDFGYSLGLNGGTFDNWAFSYAFGTPGTAPVPEPPGWTLLLPAAALGFWLTRRRLGAQSGTHG